MALGLATGVAFTWLGMVLAISFLEAPLRFRAPGVDTRIGLGIGRLVFRALNIVEAVLAAVLVISVVAGGAMVSTVLTALVAAALLGMQIGIVRPRLTRRSDRILAGEKAPRSRGHHAYVILEVLKVAALLTNGILLLRA
ncbi:hypothetical protein N5079_15025 [Planotetraspora sp. A-T 1434]|uniref:hypothetical protein n=1 Tax=Planotetraspora sp. A-T 1434 TaxID=2979219 RepID=UPI0021C230A0|nr:hypothetical protein [Planotetraspora sp. A-T 1434]MCT9931528.1 hypothetical protein [Planotetraspora sp. A-T 1434]